MNPTLSILSTNSGDKPKVFVTDDPENREKISTEIQSLIRKGTAVFLELGGGETRRITGYDPKMNEWILQKEHRQEKGQQAPRHPAQGTQATAVPARSGG